MNSRTLLAVLAIAGFTFAGDLNVIVGFKGDVDTSLVGKHGKAGRVIAGVDAVTAVVSSSKIAKLRSHPSVAYVEENGIVQVLGRRAKASAPPPGKGKPPSDGDSGDPSQIRPWGIDRCGGGLTTNTGEGIKVAVIDSGCDLNHRDLAANIKDSVDFTGSKKGADDEHGHGTHVTGTIAGIDNTIGVIGMAPKAHIYVVRVLNRRGSGTWGDVADGIIWAADKGCQIANMSIGGGHNSTIQNACHYAKGEGVLLCAAAGNSGDGNPDDTELSYPAAYASVVSVAAIVNNNHDSLANFSNSGAHVELAAPGVGVTSTFKRGAYETWNGTSMACPHVVGVAALIWKESGMTDNDAVRAELRLRVDDRGPTGRDYGYGFGVSDFDFDFGN